MARGVNINDIAKIIECEDIFDPVWFNYSFNGGWGNRLAKYKKKGSGNGTFTPGIGNEVSIPMVYKKVKDKKFDDVAGFYVAILCFFGEKVWEKLDFVEKIPKNSINKVVSALQCPEKYKDEVYEMCHTKYDFVDFISAAAKLEKTNFDEKSAISVYKLQGKAAIFPLLCQMFYQNKGADRISPCLISQLPVQLPIEVSNYLSGCHFPVMVSPASDEFKWEENDNGHFLYCKIDDNWLVLDVVNVGRFNLSNYALANRINYLGGGGRTVPFVICWNWGDVIEAYHTLGSDLLVRDLKNDFFHHYWFVFGLDSLLNVRFKGGKINSEADYVVEPGFNGSLISLNKHGIAYLITNLRADFVDYCDKKDVFYADSEVFDWFEIGKMLK